MAMPEGTLAAVDVMRGALLHVLHRVAGILHVLLTKLASHRDLLSG
jgi:hypothetical protein